MDILKEIINQVNSIKKSDSTTYLDSVLTHLDRAEYYYKQGISDSNYFNDVIYRGNQAYEGALKESFKVLADKTESEVFKKTPNDIEKFFESNNIFRERVLQLFKNYRQEWRNKSTHDHKLFFDESEAFLALTSVSSFVHLLLKQIQEKIAFNLQQKKMMEEKKQVEEINELVQQNNNDPRKKLEDIISRFAKSNASYIHNSKDIREVEIIGLFDAYIRSAKGLTIQREPKFHVNGMDIRPDFLIEVDDTSIILEFKRQRSSNLQDSNAVNQVLVYMQATMSNYGIIYFSNFDSPDPEIKIDRLRHTVNDKSYDVSIIKS